jgi:hypothetical protein
MFIVGISQHIIMGILIAVDQGALVIAVVVLVWLGLDIYCFVAWYRFRHQVIQLHEYQQSLHQTIDATLTKAVRRILFFAIMAFVAMCTPAILFVVVASSTDSSDHDVVYQMVAGVIVTIFVIAMIYWSWLPIVFSVACCCCCRASASVLPTFAALSTASKGVATPAKAATTREARGGGLRLTNNSPLVVTNVEIANKYKQQSLPPILASPTYTVTQSHNNHIGSDQLSKGLPSRPKSTHSAVAPLASSV